MDASLKLNVNFNNRNTPTNIKTMSLAIFSLVKPSNTVRNLGLWLNFQ